MVSKHRVPVSPGKVSTIVDWPLPFLVRNIKALLGLHNYYKQFLCRFAELAYPPRDLTYKGVKFHWSDECLPNFEILKSI